MLKTKGCLIFLMLMFTLLACEQPEEEEITDNKNIPIPEQITPLIPEPEPEEENQLDTLSGSWKMSLDERKGKIIEMKFSEVNGFPDYLILSNCSISEEFDFDHMYIKFLPNNKLIRIEVRETEEGFCLNKFEDLNYTLNENKTSMITFDEDTPDDTQEVFLNIEDDFFTIKLDAFNGHWKYHFHETAIVIDEREYFYSHEKLPSDALFGLINCIEIDYTNKPDGYMFDVDVYDVDAYFIDGTYAIFSIFEDKPTNDKCYLNQFEMQYRFDKNQNKIFYEFNNSPMWSVTPTFNEEKLYIWFDI